MKPLPHALFDATDTTAPPPAGCGVLVRAGDSRVDGRFVIVESGTSVETLRRIVSNDAAGTALTGWRTGADIQRLAALLSVAEAEEGRKDGTTVILAITGGILPAPVSSRGLSGKSGRLAALVWDQRTLRQALRAERTLTQAGEWTAAFAAARNAALLTAAAAGIPAYDSFPDLAGEAFTAACQRSRDDGFFGGLAAEAAQVSTIRAVYGRRG